MSDFDYGNARLHVMKSRLLSRRELDVLADVDSPQGLIAALTKTAYQKSVESALTRTTGMQCIDEALHGDLVNTVGKIRGFYKEDAGKMVALVLRIYDIHNLKAILRGLSKNIPASEILAVLLPVGELSISELRELIQLNSPREAIDLLASMGLAFAWPLLHLRSEHPGAESPDMELALDQWYYQAARQCLRSVSEMEDPLSAALALDSDLANVMTILRFAQDPHERGQLRDRPGSEGLERSMVGRGHIPVELLLSACRQDTVPAAIEILAGTSLGPVLRAGLEVFARTNRLSDIERQLRHYRLTWMSQQITRDPSGIGVVLGYVALKVNEVNNIRWIAQGITLGLKPDAIRAELEFVS